MKTICNFLKIISLNLILIFSASTLTFAANVVVIPSLEIKGGFGKKFSVILDNLNDQSTTKVILRDEYGVVLVSEKVSGEKRFAKVFNLVNIPEGDYEVVISTSLKETVQPIQVTREQVLVSDMKRKEFFAPVVNVSNNLVDLSLLNTQISDVEVEIYDEDGDLVYNEELDNVLQVQRRYNLNNITKGDYMIKVGTQQKAYFKSITIK